MMPALLFAIYLGYWGIVGVYAPFINVYFLRLGLSGREIGLLGSLLPLVTLLVAIGCGALWERIGYGLMFALAGLLFLPVVGAALLLEEGRTEVLRARSSPRVLRRDSALLALLLASFLVGAAIGADIIFSGIFMDGLGGGGLLIGAVLGVSAFSELPAMRYGGTIARRLGGPTTLLIAFALLAAGYAGTALATRPWMLLGLAILKGLGFALYFVSSVRLMDERVPPELASTIQALNAAGAWGLAPLVANPLNGALYDALGVRAVYAGCTVLMLLAALVILVSARRWTATPR